MSNKIIIHKDRALLEIRGLDRKKFIQGLITNDIEKASNSDLIYAVMLSPQGRFLYDFFIFEIDDSLIFDCFAPKRDEILQKLNFYKLRSKVEIIKNDALVAAQNLDMEDKYPLQFSDPRHQNLRNRIYIKNPESTQNNQAEYSFLRIQNKIPESENDLTYDKSFILEFGFDDIHAIDYQKGCYVGQELTARTHYRGEIRKKLLHITIENLQEAQKGQEISCEGKSVGIVLSSVFHENALHALALIKVLEGQDFDHLKNDLKLQNNKITVIG